MFKSKNSFAVWGLDIMPRPSRTKWGPQSVNSKVATSLSTQNRPGPEQRKKEVSPSSTQHEETNALKTAPLGSARAECLRTAASPSRKCRSSPVVHLSVLHARRRTRSDALHVQGTSYTPLIHVEAPQIAENEL